LIQGSVGREQEESIGYSHHCAHQQSPLSEGAANRTSCPAAAKPRAIAQAVKIIRDGGLIAYPTDSCYALGAQMGNREALDRIRSIRHLDDKHHFTLVCRDFAQLGQFVNIGNDVFRSIKAVTPGSYTFILPATKEVPKRLLHPKKKTVGVRIPDNRVVQALLAELGEPLLSSTLLLPDEEEPLTVGWEIKERLDHQVDAVIDAGDCGAEPTTVVDFSSGVAEIVRRGMGDPSRFE
jgi:tRNA threonylcarbamoyl adenosine modification protein (Sua5/YciO/YrdC/YwlC family)